jgi:hypothetical protein
MASLSPGTPGQSRSMALAARRAPVYLGVVVSRSSRSRARLRAAAAAAALTGLGVLVVALTAGLGGSAHAGVTDELLPDLVTRPFSDVHLDPGRRDFLRLGNTIANGGSGPLEIFPEEGTSDCDGEEGEDRFAYQRVFHDTVADGVFDRSEDVDQHRLESGCMAFHPQHEHWHFGDFSRYRLKHQATGEIAADSTKVSFCVLDTSRPFPTLPGSPNADYYPQPGSVCDADATEGISVGWADTYGSSLKGQALDVTGLPKGRYCLISVADPSNRLLETDETNNARRSLLFLNPRTGKLVRLPDSC